MLNSFDWLIVIKKEKETMYSHTSDDTVTTKMIVERKILLKLFMFRHQASPLQFNIYLLFLEITEGRVCLNEWHVNG